MRYRLLLLLPTLLFARARAQNTGTDILLEGEMPETQFHQALRQINTQSSVSAYALSTPQVRQLVKHLNRLGSVARLELNEMSIQDSTFSEARFYAGACFLYRCTAGTPPCRIPPTAHLGIVHASPQLVVQALRGTRLPDSLTINGCNLSGQKEVFRLLQKSRVRYLNLAGCSLERLPLELNHMPRLRAIDISSNNISLLDTTGLHLLHSFSCRNNPIAALFHDFSGANRNTAGKSLTGNRHPGNELFFAPAHPFLAPASQNFSVLPQAFTFNAAVGADIRTAGGAFFYIPPNAFAGKGGKALKGEVTLVIHEYNDPLSIMLAGIPLFTDTATQTSYLVSDGMFNISAFAGQTPLELKKGSKIEVTYPSANALTAGNQLYDLNPVTGSWDNVSRGSAFSGALGDTSANGRKKSPAVKQYLATLQDFQTVRDPYTYEQRFNDKWHAGENLLDSCLLHNHHTFEQVYNRNAMARAFALRKKTVKTGNRQQTLVRIVPLKPGGRRVYGAIQGLWWQVKEHHATEAGAGMPAYAADIRLEQGADSSIVLHLKDEKGIHRFSLEGFTHSGSKMLKEKARENAMATIHRQQQRDLLLTPKVSQTIHTVYAGRTPRQRWRSVKKLRNSEERHMSFRQFHYYATGSRAGAHANPTDASIYYQFSLTGLGMKNIDCQHSMKKPVQFMAQTADRDTLVRTYVYQPAGNLLINFTGGGKCTQAVAEATTGAYLVNVCNNEVGFAWLEKEELARLAQNKTLTTVVKVPVEEFTLDRLRQQPATLNPLISPNPTSGVLTITLGGYPQFDVQVYTPQGQLVMDLQNHTGGTPIDLGNSPNGTYIIHISLNGIRVATEKIIKQF